MRLNDQLARVSQAEQALQDRLSDIQVQTQRLGARWRANLTPGRVLLSGLVAGFLVGRARPFQLAGSAGVLNLLRTVSQLISDVQAQVGATATPPTDDTGTAG